MEKWKQAKYVIPHGDALDRVLNWMGDQGAREAFRYINRQWDLGIDIDSRDKRQKLKEKFLRTFDEGHLADELVMGMGTDEIRRMLQDNLFSGFVSSKTSNFIADEQYYLRSRKFDQFEGKINPDSDEGSRDTDPDILSVFRDREDLEKEAYGYFKQDDFDSWHDEEVDLDDYGIEEEVDDHGETGHWWDQPQEMPHVVEEGDQAEDNIPTASFGPSSEN